MQGRTLLLVLGMACSCLPDDGRAPPGRLLVTASAEEPLDIAATEDGWSVHFRRFLVSLGHSEIVGAGCGAYVQAFGGYLRILDVTRPGAQRVGLLHGLGTCDFQFRVANPSADSVLGEGVSQADRTFMRTPGLDPYGTRGGPSIYIEGQARRGAVEKRFAWAFRHRTDFRECAAVEGRLIVLEGEMDQTVDIRIRGTALFRERDAPPRFDPFAAADDVHGNRDGEVTLEELVQTPFGDGKSGTLGDAVYRDRALSVFGYRDSGTCTLRDGTDDD